MRSLRESKKRSKKSRKSMKKTRGGASKKTETSINPLTGRPFSERYNELQQVINTFPMNQPETVRDLLAMVDKHQISILTAETGAGKSTSMGRHLLPYLSRIHGKTVNIIITQPRQYAAETIAKRVAEEMDVEVGSQVGYQYQGANITSAETRINFVTEGVLVLRFREDPDLQTVNAIVIDETHERHVETDMILLFVKKLVQKGWRPDMKIILMSATADVESWRKYFTGCGEMFVRGKTYPVDTRYLNYTPNQREYVNTGIDQIVKITNDEKLPDGDILFFLTGPSDMKSAQEQLDSPNVKNKIRGTYQVFRFKSGLAEDVAKPIREYPASRFGVDRKIILSTNVAEASVTIDGIVFVVDSGRALMSDFDPHFQHGILDNTFISRAAVIQRRGRAGRTRPGHAFELFSKSKFENLDEYTKPAILREDFTNWCLFMMTIPGWGTVNQVRSVMKEMLTPPSDAAIKFVFHKLALFGAIDDNGELTDVGKRLARLQVDIELARAIYFSTKYGVRNEVISLAAMLSTAKRFSDFCNEDEPHARLRDADGDNFSLIKICQSAEILDDTSLAKFCRSYNLHFSNVFNAVRKYRGLKYSYESLFAYIPKFQEGITLSMNIPYFKAAWITSEIGGDIRDRIVRCMLHGFFRNCAIKRDQSMFSIDTDVKLGIKSRQDMCIYMGLIRSGGRFMASGISEIKNVVWFADAAAHFIPTISIKKNRESIVNLLRDSGQSVYLEPDVNVTTDTSRRLTTVKKRKSHPETPKK